jgi:hypothetical protein
MKLTPPITNKIANTLKRLKTAPLIGTTTGNLLAIEGLPKRKYRHPPAAKNIRAATPAIKFRSKLNSSGLSIQILAISVYSVAD